MEDREELIENSGDAAFSGRRSKCCSHPRFACFSLTLILILIGHGLAIYFIYFRDFFVCSPENCTHLRVMSLNCWGMPATFGSKYKTQRIEAIAEELAKAEYDLYLFEELWMRQDYYVIKEHVPEGYHISDYAALTHGKCDGKIAPDWCSGLAVVSKYPIEEIDFHMYAVCGNMVKIFVDGECLVSKGVGRIRISPANLTLNLDVFVTHTVADPDPSHGYNNSYYRKLQVHQLVDEFLKASTADAIILGGDFNAGPEFDKGSPYQIIQEYMQNCIEDIYYKLRAWLNPKYATYANAKNTFSYNIQDPVIYDYIFHRVQNKIKAHMWTNWFEMPFFMTKADHGNISFSDHEAVTSSLSIKQLVF